MHERVWVPRALGAVAVVCIVGTAGYVAGWDAGNADASASLICTAPDPSPRPVRLVLPTPVVTP